MGKILGILALVFGLIGLLGGWLLVIFLPFGEIYLPFAAMVFGIIGIFIDDSKGIAKMGLLLGGIGLIFVIFVLPIILYLFFGTLIP